MKFAHPHPNYEYRLTRLAQGTVYPGCTAEQVKADIERRRELEGDVVAEDFRAICREMWRRLGL